MKHFLLILLLAGCASKPLDCPVLPDIRADQTPADYTTQVINLYNICRKSWTH